MLAEPSTLTEAPPEPVTTKPPVQPADAPPRRPNLFQMIRAVARATGCSRLRAYLFIQMLRRAAIWAEDGEAYLLTRWDMAVSHRLMEHLMPDHAGARPGSVHALLNRGLLSGGAITFYHTKVLRNERGYCGITVQNQRQAVQVLSV